jgi:cytochrome P450
LNKLTKKMGLLTYSRCYRGKEDACSHSEVILKAQCLTSASRFTLDAIGLVGFGFQFNATNTPDGEWVKIYNDVVSNIVDFKYLFFPIFETKLLRFFPKRMEKHANLTKLNQLFDEIIEHKKAELVKSKSEVEDSEKDLLTLMIEAGNDEGDSSEPLTNEELRDELVLFFVAGYVIYVSISIHVPY